VQTLNNQRPQIWRVRAFKYPSPQKFGLVEIKIAVLRSANPTFSLYQGPQIYLVAVFRSANPNFRCIKVRKSIFLAVSTSAHPKIIAGLTSANPVCADFNIETSAEIRCGVQTLNHSRAHLIFRCVSLLCVLVIEQPLLPSLPRTLCCTYGRILFFMSEVPL